MKLDSISFSSADLARFREDDHLTAHFKYSEFFTRAYRPKNLPEVLACINRLVTAVLEPARKSLGVPIIVNSGYRSSTHNKSVGGVSNSNHLTGRAADVTCKNRSDLLMLFKILSNRLFYLQSKGYLSRYELIFYPTFIHVAI